ncbi:uncharacterized protein [Typha latifolia]|uniref:uncharacterized protein isoform X2 n=1 Tax=Typha latifolia TaxID=4733 RepID=UPI003C2E0BA0
MGAFAISSTPLSNPTGKMLSFLLCKLRVNPKFPNPSPSFSPIFSSLHTNPTPEHTQATVTASTPKTLSSIFTNPPLPRKDAAKRDKKWVPSSGSTRYRPMEEKGFPKELSPEAASLVRRLQEEGYVKEASFSRVGQLGQDKIPPNSYSRHFLKSAAEKFGQDHQEIAKWLSGSELKKVALFGCPSVERGTIFAAKRLRAFFKIQEDTVNLPFLQDEELVQIR